METSRFHCPRSKGPIVEPKKKLHNKRPYRAVLMEQLFPKFFLSFSATSFSPQQATVEWARYKERDARFGAGLENSFSSFDQTSLCIKTSVVRESGQAAE